MFEVGFTEIILIFGIALLVLGPERLPKLAADLGRWAGRARAMARTLRTQLEQEVRFDPLNEPKKHSSASPTIHAPAPPVDEKVGAEPIPVADQSATPTPEGPAPTQPAIESATSSDALPSPDKADR